ncbi:MAG: exodeoxyribonuclease VII small subunit [Bacillota bacterium]|nr:exodeoxyribonuclease VII small subunit [Bacillota bacterium]
METAKTKKQDITFEEGLVKLEGIVEKLEKEDMPLEKMIGLFEEGIQLSKLCKTKLDESQARIDMLVEKDGGMSEAPFEE